MFVHPGAKQAKTIELQGALYNAIMSAHGEQAAAAATPLCRVLYELRAPVHETPTSEHVMSGLKRYVVALNHTLDVAKLPPKTCPPLMWFSAFNTDSSCTVPDLRLDRQGALYNLAVCHASLAITTFRMRPPTDDDVAFRRSILLFRQAAGLFAAVAAHPCAASSASGAANLTHDLHPATLLALEKAMLANAQQVFLERNIVMGTSHLFNARFALGARDFYHAAQNACADPELQGTIVDGALARPCTALRAYFDVRALDLLARESHDRGAVGEEIARLSAAQTKLQAAQAAADALEASPLPYISALKVDLKRKYAALARELSQRIENASEENRRIYFETVPNSLPEVRGRQSVAPVDFREVIMTESLHEDVHAFIGFPEPPAPELSAAAARYKDLASGHVSQRISQLNNATSGLTLAISSVEVMLATAERSVNDAASQSSREEPRQINPVDDRKALDTVRAAQRRGGLRALNELQTQVLGLAKDAKESLQTVDKLLLDEEAQDRQLRLEVQVSRPHSSQIAQPYSVKLAKLRANLERAANADLIVSRQADDNRAAMAQLDGVDVPEVLPEAPAPGANIAHRAGDLGSVAEQARPTLEEARALLLRKDALATEYERRKIGEDHFRATASLTAPEDLADVDQIGAIMRTAYQDLDTDAEALLREIQAKEAQLKGLKGRAEAVSSSSGSDTADEYLRCMNDIYKHQAAAAKLMELIGHLEQGLQFYSKEADNVKLLITDTEGFVKARDTEFRDLISRPPPGGGMPSSAGSDGTLYPQGPPGSHYGGYNQQPGSNYPPSSAWRRQ